MIASTFLSLLKQALDHPKTKEALAGLQTRLGEPPGTTLDVDDLPGFGMRVSGTYGEYRYNLTIHGDLGKPPTVAVTVTSADATEVEWTAEDEAADLTPPRPKGEVTTGPWEGSVVGPDDNKGG